MKFSLRFNNDLPAADYVTLARAAEAAGFAQFWVSDDLFLRSAPVILTAVAAATERIEIGTCILNPYTIHPAEIAMLAATLDEVSGGRFNLGIAAGAGDFLNWIDIHPTKPVTALRESITAINRLLSGERVEMQGEFLRWGNEAYLRFKPRRRVPVYIGAMSPNMLRLIGEIGDGGLPLLFPPEHYETVLPYIREGAEGAGRSLDDLDLAACVWCAIGGQDSEDALRDKIAYYGHSLSPLIWNRLGLTKDDFEPLTHAMVVQNEPLRARELVTPQMLKIGITGTTQDLIARMSHLVDLGVRHLSFGPPLGADPLAAIQAIGRDLIPYFGGGHAL